jgi:hypothetical protein
MFGSILVLCNHITLYEAKELYYVCQWIYFGVICSSFVIYDTAHGL